MGKIHNFDGDVDRDIDRDLHQKFSEYGANAREWMRRCILLLPEIERRRIWEKKGFSCINEYAGKLAGMNKDQVREGLRIMKKFEDKPALIKVIEMRGINVVKPIAAIVTKENEKFWAEKAGKMSQHTLETYVREFRKSLRAEAIDESPQTLLLDQFADGDRPQKIILSLDLSPHIAEKLKKIKGESWDETIEELLKLREEKLKMEKPKIVEAKRKSGEISDYIPAKIKKFIKNRSSGKCEFPDCKKSAKIMHHTERFAIVKKHDPDHIFYLCTEHERLAHLGLIENEDRCPERWRVRKLPDMTELKYLVDQRVQDFRSRQRL